MSEKQKSQTTETNQPSNEDHQTIHRSEITTDSLEKALEDIHNLSPKLFFWLLRKLDLE